MANIYIWGVEGKLRGNQMTTTRFHFRIDGGIERAIDTKTGDYSLAAAAALATEENVSLPAVIQIWVPDLLPDYGPYVYLAKNDECERLVVGPCIVTGGGG